MGVHAEGNYEAQEFAGRLPGAAVQLGGVHVTLYVSFKILFWTGIVEEALTISLKFGAWRSEYLKMTE